MKLGIVLAGILSRGIDYAELCKWAAANGYGSVDVPPSNLGAAEIARQHGLEPGMTGGLRGLITADEGEREKSVAAALDHLENVAKAGVKFVMIGHARVPEADDATTLAALKAGWTPVVERAEKLGLKVMIENYAANGRNFAISPFNWRRIFEAVPSPALGLCFDPSHAVALGVDYLRVVYEFGSRIYFAHAKDTEISPEGLYQHGYTGFDFGSAPNLGRRPLGGQGWWRFTLPGQGVVDWGRYVAALREAGFDGTLAVEHEDDAWGWRDDVPLTLRGLAVTGRYLSNFVG